MLRPDMAKILAQNFQQGFVRCEGDIHFFAIQRESYVRRFLRFYWKRRHILPPFKGSPPLRDRVFC